jgi:hypothetical protein
MCVVKKEKRTPSRAREFIRPSSKRTDHGEGTVAFYSKHLTVVVKLFDIVTLEAQILVPVIKGTNAISKVPKESERHHAMWW